MDNKILRIKGYETKSENGDVQYFAVGLDDERYPMPAQYAHYYNGHYLAIRKKIMQRPEVLGFELTEAEVYIPLFTDPIE